MPVMAVPAPPEDKLPSIDLQGGQAWTPSPVWAAMAETEIWVTTVCPLDGEPDCASITIITA